MDQPARYFMMRRFLGRVGSDQVRTDRVRVRMELDCGCEVEREVNASCLLDTADSSGREETLVAGKFVCGRHSFGAA